MEFYLVEILSNQTIGKTRACVCLIQVDGIRRKTTFSLLGSKTWDACLMSNSEKTIITNLGIQDMDRLLNGFM